MRRIALVVTLAALAASVGCHRFEQFQRGQAVDHFVSGQLLADRGELDAALDELSRAVRLDPGLSVAHAAIGDIHRKRGDVKLARVSYRNACDANPYAFRPHYNLGVVCQMLADAAANVADARKYLREAVEVYLRAVTLKPEDYEANLNLAACYFEQGKRDLAESYLRAAIAADGARPEAYANLGIVYDAQGRYYEAVKAYKDSLELDVDQPGLLVNLAVTYLRQNRLDAAEQTLRTALRQADDNADAWEALGTCLYRRKQYDDALDAYRRATELDGANAAAFRGMGVVLMTRYLLNGKDTSLRDRALAAWHKSLEIEPGQEEIIKLVRKYTPQPTGPDL